MAVSFLSKTLSSNPYVSPINEDLLYKSLLQKQQRFDQGVQQVDSLLQNLNEQSILNEGHNQYYQQKVADLTSRINSLGGADFSSRDTLQQIGGFSQEISKDQRILGAISDTRKIQKAQAQNELWKSDPKKYGNSWAPQNEFDLQSKIQSYSTDSSTTARFTGEATPYMDHNKLINDRLTSIRKQIQQSGGYQSTDGQYIRVDKQLTPLQIRSIVEGELQGDPRLMNQLRLDANYQFRGTPTDSADFQKARISQLQQAKALLEQQANQYNNGNLLKLATGTHEERQAQAAQHRAQLQQIAAQLASYDNQIKQAGTLSRDQQILGMHLDGYVAKYQAEYSLDERQLRADPNYSVNVAHQDRQAALGQADRHFNIGQYNDNQQLLYNWKMKFDELEKQQTFEREMKNLDISAKTSLHQNKDGSYSTPISELKVVDLGATGVTTPTLSDLHARNQLTAGNQNKLVEDLLISYVGQADARKAIELRGRLRPVTDSSGNLTGFKYPTSVAPNVAEASRQILDQYGKLLQGKPVDAGFLSQLSSESRELFQQLQTGNITLKLQQDEVTSLNQKALKASGMTPQELSEMTRLQQGKKSNWAGYSSRVESVGLGGEAKSGFSYLDNRLSQLEGKYKPALTQVTQDIGATGQYSRGYLVTGKSAEKDSDLQRVVRQRINQQAISPQGATNSQFQQLSANLEGAQLTELTILPGTQQVRVKAVIKGKDDKVTDLGYHVIDFVGTADWNAVLPDLLRETGKQANTQIKAELDQKGHLSVGKDPVLFNTRTSDLHVAVTPGRNQQTGQYNLRYLYQGSEIPLPMRFKNGVAFVPLDYQQDPITWSQTKLDSWFDGMVVPLLRKQYELENPGKLLSGYTPSVADLNRLLKNKTLF